MTAASEFRHVPAQPPLPGLEKVKLTGGTATPLYPEPDYATVIEMEKAGWVSRSIALAALLEGAA